MKTFNYVCLSFVVCSVLFCSCSNEIEKAEEPTTKNLINVEPISTSTRTIDGLDLFKEGYHCTSATSSLNSNIFINDDRTEAITLMLNKENEVAYYLHFVIDEKTSDNSATFTAFNEFEEPIMSGVYNEKENVIDFTKVYDNYVVTRASAASWGCNLSLWTCGTIWSVAVGTVSLGGGLIVGLAYTAAAVQICDGL